MNKHVIVFPGDFVHKGQLTEGPIVPQGIWKCGPQDLQVFGE